MGCHRPPRTTCVDPVSLSLIAGRVWNDITQAARSASEPAHVAVAYFGSSGSRLLPLPSGSHLVVDASVAAVSAGQTCPDGLVKLQRRGTRIYSYQGLHAKVYVFQTEAFIGSANVSYSSSDTLFEAMLRTNSPHVLNAARAFVLGLCVSELDPAALARLQQLYRPPRYNPATPTPRHSGSTLIMELTLEQGGGRATQVQPPAVVWSQYFGIDVHVRAQPAPLLTLVNELTSSAERRQVVYHGHVCTIEIGGAGPPLPAILRMKRVTQRKYKYSVFRPGDSEFDRLRSNLDLRPNPEWTHGRRWLVV